jgi:MFS transporter, DHA1 family, multidrug resistance protein
MTHTLLVTALALLLGLQPLVTDLYTPSLPSLPGALNTTIARVQLTLSLCMLAFGVAQLVVGPWSDRVGRKPVLLSGVGLFTVGSIAAAFAPTIDWLIVARVLQGAGAATAVVCSRAMLRDLFDPQSGARVLAAALMGLSAIPLIAPPLGGWIETHLNWRASFGVMTLFGALVFALVWLRIRETLPDSKRNPTATQMGPLFRNWLAIAQSHTFWVYTAITSSTYAGLFAYISGSAFVMIQVLGISKQGFGFVFSSMVVGYLIGATLCKRLLATRTIVQTLRIGAVFSIGGALLYLLAWLMGFPSWLWIGAAQFVYMLGHGIYNPCGQAGMIAPFPRMAGAAAALGGFISMVVAFAVGSWMGWAFNQTAVPLAGTIGFFGLATALLALVCAPRWGRV